MSYRKHENGRSTRAVRSCEWALRPKQFLANQVSKSLLLFLCKSCKVPWGTRVWLQIFSKKECLAQINAVVSKDFKDALQEIVNSITSWDQVAKFGNLNGD